jgi:tight adherence protein C
MLVEDGLYYLLVAVSIFGAMVGLLLSLRMTERERTQTLQRRLRKRVGIISAIDFEAAENDKCVWCDIGMALAPSKPEELQAARNKLAFAGYRSKEHLAAFFLIKFGGSLLLGALGIVALVWEMMTTTQVVVLVLSGLYVPEFAMRYLANQRMYRINRALPDLLDLTNVCMSAGMTWMGSLQRVTEELKSIHPEIVREFGHMMDQVQAGMPSHDALLQLSARNPSPDIQHFCNMLVQNEKLGTSISDSLQEFAQRLYAERELEMEEQAGKVAGKMAIVIMLFLMMPFMLLMVGEKMVHLSRSFG